MSPDAKKHDGGSPRTARRVRYGLACVLVAVLAGAACVVISRLGGRRGAPCAALPSAPAPVAAATSAASPKPTVQTCVGLYLKRVTSKKYGWAAHVSGRRDCVEDRTVMDPRKNWWETPAVLYQDVPMANPDVAAGADVGEIKGSGSSPNVEVRTTVTGHATLALKTATRSDCMKGTITVTLNGSGQYYDDDWTPLFEVKDRTLVFAFDTRDPARPVTVTGTDCRAFHVFLELYRRDTQRWSPKSEWPDTRERADTRTVLYSRDATLEVTGYRYDDVALPTSRR